MVYDLMPYNGERAILEIRMNELKDVVDWFCICQSTQTISGLDRPIYDVAKEFPEFSDRMIHFFAPACGPVGSLWDREWFQRNYCKDALGSLNPNDFLIYGDVDEIPRSEQMENLKAIAFEHGCCAFKMDWYFYYLNVHSPGLDFAFPAVFRGEDANRLVAHDLRWGHVNQEGYLKNGYKCVENAGWHFTYQGGREEVIRKLKSFGHANDPGVSEIIYDYEHGEDPMDREARLAGRRLAVIPIDSSFPVYLREHQDQFADMIL